MVEKAILILGFRNVNIDNVDNFLKNVKTSIYPAIVQIIDATRVAGEAHLFFAFLNAQKSFEDGRAISENLEMETLLFASGNKQISRAIEMLGLKPQTSDIAVIVFVLDKNEVKNVENKLIKVVSGTRDDSVLEIGRRGKIKNLMKTFGVTELELKTVIGSGMKINEALTWLIVERVSLLSIKR